MHASHLIDGVLSKSDPVFPIVDPATGETLLTVAEATRDDVARAVASAKRAYRGEWRTVRPRDRGRQLLRLATLIRENAEELAGLESTNVGKPIREARDEVALAADCFEYYGGATNKILGSTIPVSANGVAMTFREPLGVCALIIPWNFPIAIASWKVAPALAMGNTVVVKPAEQTPFTAVRLAELALDAGIPPGVFNILLGRGSDSGEALVTHPDVRKIAFTGSTEVGTRVMKLAADDIKRVTLELGGKSANIIFADSDLERAAASAASSALGNAGQDCCARSRILVERTVHDEFVERLKANFESLHLGDPLDDQTDIGPLVTSGHRDRVAGYVAAGVHEGATLVCGGDAPADGPLARGSYLRPAIFTDVRAGMTIAREEIFGPVVAVMPFATEDEAVSIANDSSYGLSGSIWSKDGGRAMRVARAIETGVLSINSGSSVHLEAPFGGVKRSGLGRELGMTALEHYSELKSIFFSTE